MSYLTNSDIMQKQKLLIRRYQPTDQNRVIQLWHEKETSSEYQILIKFYYFKINPIITYFPR